MVKLNCQIMGEGEPLVILHGLYGMLDNWVGIARQLQHKFKIYLVDLRNHGMSDHSDEHNYQVMADDINQFMNDQGLFSANIMGHSMGGKVALAFSLLNPERIKRLIVVDISPRTYHVDAGDIQLAEHAYFMQVLMELDLASLYKREEADLLLADKIPSSRIRSFLLKNLGRKPDLSFYWKMNIEVLFKSLNHILKGFEADYVDFKLLHCPVLFIKGEKSPYIGNSDYDLIAKIFINAKVVEIAGASHWVHAEKPAEFIQVISEFVSS